MALSDRPYAVGYSNFFPRGVRWLLIANFAIFIINFFAAHSGYYRLFVPFFLDPDAVIGSLAIWQLVTYLFLHDVGGFSHILFNMLALWMFGLELERTWGTHQFLKYYFICGIGAGICVVLADLIFGGAGRTIGASGAIYGLLGAFGYLFPNREILFSFLFPIKAKYFVMIIGAIAFMSSFAAPGGPVSHLAHLGGLVIGILYLRSQGANRLSPRGAGQAAGYPAGYGAYGAVPRKKPRPNPIALARNWYKEWKLQRARRKFEVYLRKHNRDRDPFVH
jgi:membrane associated rhomboid family serine protease